MDLTADLSGPHRHGGILVAIQCVSALLLKRPRSRGVRVTRSPFTPTEHPVDSVGSPPFYVATRPLDVSGIRALTPFVRLGSGIPPRTRREHFAIRDQRHRGDSEVPVSFKG